MRLQTKQIGLFGQAVYLPATGAQAELFPGALAESHPQREVDHRGTLPMFEELRPGDHIDYPQLQGGASW